MKLESILAFGLSIFLAVSSAAATTAMQARDHLTPEEVDLVKDSQVLDQRVGIFVKAIDRRLSCDHRRGPWNREGTKTTEEGF